MASDTTSSPRYTQANGEAEQAVQTIKRLIGKSADPYLALLSYRATPLQQGYSPAELLMGRSFRTTVLTAQCQLKPHQPDQNSLRQKDKQLKEAQKNYYDNQYQAKDREPLKHGDRVWIQDQELSGTVLSETCRRSYMLQTHNSTVCRNKGHLKRLPDQTEDCEDLYATENPTEDHTNDEGPDEPIDATVEPRRSGRLR